MIAERTAVALAGCRGEADGRILIDELPPGFAVAEAEIELLSQHVHAIVAALLDDIVEDVG